MAPGANARVVQGSICGGETKLEIDKTIKLTKGGGTHEKSKKKNS